MAAEPGWYRDMDIKGYLLCDLRDARSLTTSDSLDSRKRKRYDIILFVRYRKIYDIILYVKDI